jgi:hypothetical protein
MTSGVALQSPSINCTDSLSAVTFNQRESRQLFKLLVHHVTVTVIANNLMILAVAVRQLTWYIEPAS